jgi:ADP-ribose pyrophosphatase YjhB (NUDIX family)
VIEEKTRKGTLEFPGGTTEVMELVRSSAARELQEEVNINVPENKLQLCAIANRVKANRFNANSVVYYYLVDSDFTTGIVQPDNKEVVQAFFVPLQDLIHKSEVDNLKVFPTIAAIAKHIYEGRKKTYMQNFLDYRQLSQPEAARDNNDIMTIEFLAQ